jgi:hypothetical protein
MKPNARGADRILERPLADHVYSYVSPSSFNDQESPRMT